MKTLHIGRHLSTSLTISLNRPHIARLNCPFSDRRTWRAVGTFLRRLNLLILQTLKNLKDGQGPHPGKRPFGGWIVWVEAYEIKMCMFVQRTAGNTSVATLPTSPAASCSAFGALGYMECTETTIWMHQQSPNGCMLCVRTWAHCNVWARYSEPHSESELEVRWIRSDLDHQIGFGFDDCFFLVLNLMSGADDTTTTWYKTIRPSLRALV